MIRQYLSNKNESATVAKSEIFSELNKALATWVYCYMVYLSLDATRSLSMTRLGELSQNKYSCLLS